VRPRTALLATYCVLLLWPFIWYRENGALYSDEIGFGRAGHAAVTHLLHGDLLGPSWTANDHGDYGWPNPMLAKYLIGASLYLTGHGGDEYFSTDQLGVPRDEQVRDGRWLNALLGWGTCLVLLAIGSRIHLGIGVVAAALAALNDAFVYNTTLAMLEAPLLFFSLLTLLLLLRLKDRLYAAARTAAAARGAAAVAIAAGCAMSSKLLGGTAFLFALAFLAALAATALVPVCRLPRPRLAMLALLTVLLATPAVFVGLNPQFYAHPFAQLRRTLSFWSERQAPGALGPGAIATRERGFGYVTGSMFAAGGTSKKPLQPLADGISARFPRAQESYNRIYVRSWVSVEAVLIFFAALSVVADRRRDGCAAPLSDQEALVGFALFIWAAMGAWLPTLYQRYFVLPFAATPLLVAIGLDDVLVPLRRLLWRRVVNS